MSELSKLIGRQIRLIRDNKNLTQDHVAERTGREGYNKARISRIETGKENITLETLEVVMNALEITPYELFDFGKYQDPLDYEQKQQVVEAYKHMLLERGLDEIEYVIRTSKDFFGTLDSKK
ncbi:helix-turn-helix domain-containing protein [Paenibacillus sp. NEAU-GSW1]|uniref:helix-turn-helix domain-containing protein n=1 Tax=Paenibacillus sp. NEAU-GSW1 TaxID=2682486 RepID=UPI0012E21109|nr:helix-turn-helix transcriptional regulator [Paenibacillus sp. NEAU-GSW1]MUT65664.1 helix-turn-helix domain-containing protein [Paenibacillus sp. NEAU-GSW1]